MRQSEAGEAISNETFDHLTFRQHWIGQIIVGMRNPLRYLILELTLGPLIVCNYNSIGYSIFATSWFAST